MNGPLRYSIQPRTWTCLPLRAASAPGSRVPVTADKTYKSVPAAKKLQVFLSHASANKRRLYPIVETLIDQGFRLWIDRPEKIGLPHDYEARIALNRIYFGDDWREGIRHAVKKANFVIAFWSKDAVNGRREQFHYEVYLGLMQKKLKQCRIDKVELDQIADLSDIATNEYCLELDYLMQDLVREHRSWWFI